MLKYTIEASPYEDAEGMIMTVYNEDQEASKIIIKDIKFLDEPDGHGNNLTVKSNHISGPEVPDNMLGEIVKEIITDNVERIEKEMADAYMAT